nr:peroxisomal N(1)-acetyl-spermine/spermidine oxidase-like isoform X2 [Cherax quadricarinatus]
MWNLVNIVVSIFRVLIMYAPIQSANFSTEDGALVDGSDHPCDHLTGSYQTWLSKAVEVEVVVVGGGVAGLTAVKTLLENEVNDVIVLEAQDRLGGRIRTIRQDGVLVEEGAEWIHGGTRNPVNRLAASLQALDPILPDDAWDWRLVTQDGRAGDHQAYELAEKLLEKCKENGILTPYYNTSYGQYYVDGFHKHFKSRSSSDMKKAALRYLEQMVNYMEGTGSWFDISARDADQFVDYGDDFQWKDGYDTLITYLKESIPDSAVKLSSPVCKIFWDEPAEERVLVVTLTGDAYLASHVIVTASVAHLQERHTHIFHPALPQSLVNALMNVRLGVANKVQVGWAEPWWGSKPLELHILWTTFDLSENMSWLYGVTIMFSIHQHWTVLETFVTGANSTYMESLPESIVKEHILYLLRRVIGDIVPEPTFFRRTRWGSNPWTRGSYSSFITLDGDKAGIHRHDQLASPLVNSKGKTEDSC